MQKYHMLKKDGKIHFPEQIVFFDAETTERISKGTTTEDWEEKTLTLRLGWAMHWDRSRDIKTWKYFTTGPQLWEWVENLPYPEIVIFAHNVMFDMTVTSGFTQLLSVRGWMTEKIYMEGNVFMLELQKETRKILIYDTMNYAPTSLKTLGEAIGTPKMPTPDFNNVTDQALSIYCKNDVLVLSQFIRILFRFLEKNDLTRFRPTAASLASGAFRHRFHDPKHRPIWIHARADAVALERDSYLGGICDCFKIGRFKTRLHKLDINSMYPHIMRNNPLPSKLEWSSNTPTHEDLHLALTGGKDAIADVTITLPADKAYIAAKFTKNQEDKTGFIAGTFRCCITTPELQYVLKNGTIDKIHRLSIYNKTELFKEYVDFFYTHRIKYDKTGNTAFSMLCKLFLNALYGKWAAKDREYEELTCDAAPDFSNYEFIRENDRFRVLHFGKKIWKITKTEDNAEDSFVAISSLITARARMHMIKIIEDAGRQNTYYCDTDSIIVNDEGLQNLKNANHLDRAGKKTLGKLKYEGESRDSEFIRPKHYTFAGETKIKGVRKKHDNLMPDPKKPGTIRIQQEQFTRAKTNMRDGDIERQRIVKVIKNIRIDYDKGAVDNHDVIPFNAADIDPFIKSDRLHEVMEAAAKRAQQRRMPETRTPIKQAALHDAYAHLDRSLAPEEQFINPSMKELLSEMT